MVLVKKKKNNFQTLSVVMSVRLITPKLSKINSLSVSSDELNNCWQNNEIYQIKTKNDKITVTFAMPVCHTM